MRRWAACRSRMARRSRPRISTPRSRTSRHRCRVREVTEMTSLKTGRTGLVLLAATILVVAACGSKKYGTPPAAANSSPAISAITSRVSSQDTVVGPIEFAIADRESDASLLEVTAVADGASVVDADG